MIPTTKGFVLWLICLVEKMSARTQKTRLAVRRLVNWPPPIDSEMASLLYCDEVLDGAGDFLYLDKDVSVSALPEAGRGYVQSEMFDRKGDPYGS